jgi:uncharacterized protein (TIGR02271 family)
MMETNAPTSDQLFGYDVLDSAQNRIGTVDHVWVDEATNDLEFIGVKTGWLFGHIHLIPTANAQFGDSTITVPFDESQIKDAPSFSADHELTPDEEDQIYQYYGVQRSTAASPTGLSAGAADSASTATAASQDYAAVGSDVTGGNEQQVTLSEEELQVGKREVEAGRVRLRKVVNTEHQEVPVELEREQVSVERAPAAATDVPTNAFQEQEVEVPVMREEPVVSKEAHATEQVALNRNVQTETRTVGGDVRSEDVVVEGDTPGTTTYQGVTGGQSTDRS